MNAVASTIHGILQAWQARRTAHIIVLAKTITAETDIDEFVQVKVRELLAEHLTEALTVIIIKLAEVGEDIDTLLQWTFIRDQSLRARFEAHDNPAVHAIDALNALADALERAAEEARDTTDNDAAKRLAEQLLGGGPATGFFGRGSRRKSALKARRKTLAAARDRLSAAQPDDAISLEELRAQLAAEQAAHERLLQSNAEQIATIQALEEQIAALSSEDTADATAADAAKDDDAVAVVEDTADSDAAPDAVEAVDEASRNDSVAREASEADVAPSGPPDIEVSPPFAAVAAPVPAKRTLAAIGVDREEQNNAKRRLRVPQPPPKGVSGRRAGHHPVKVNAPGGVS